MGRCWFWGAGTIRLSSLSLPWHLLRLVNAGFPVCFTIRKAKACAAVSPRRGEVGSPPWMLQGEGRKP